MKDKKPESISATFTHLETDAVIKEFFKHYFTEASKAFQQKIQDRIEELVDKFQKVFHKEVQIYQLKYFFESKNICLYVKTLEGWTLFNKEPIYYGRQQQRVVTSG